MATHEVRMRHPERSLLSTFVIFLGVPAIIPGAALSFAFLWFRTGGDPIQAVFIGPASALFAFWSLSSFLRRPPRSTRHRQAGPNTVV